MKRRTFIRSMTFGFVGMATVPHYIKRVTPSPDDFINLSDKENWQSLVTAIAGGVVSGVAIETISDWIDNHEKDNKENWATIPVSNYKSVRKKVITQISNHNRNDLKVPLYWSHLQGVVSCTTFHAINENKAIAFYNNDSHFRLKAAEPIALGTCIPMFNKSYGNEATTKFMLPHKIYQIPSHQDWLKSYDKPVIIINPNGNKTEINYRKIDNYNGEITIRLMGNQAPTFNKAFRVQIS